MRKIEEQVCGAFAAHSRASNGNTASDGERLTLHGNRIAEWRGEDRQQLWVSLANWPTPTTRSRLNALFTCAGIPAAVYQQRGDQRLDAFGFDREINAADWVRVI